MQTSMATCLSALCVCRPLCQADHRLAGMGQRVTAGPELHSNPGPLLATPDVLCMRIWSLYVVVGTSDHTMVLASLTYGWPCPLCRRVLIRWR